MELRLRMNKCQDVAATIFNGAFKHSVALENNISQNMLMGQKVHINFWRDVGIYFSFYRLIKFSIDRT